MPGTLVISLDFELHWGVRDVLTVAQCSDKLLGTRRAVSELLELFTGYQIHATWAAVGFLFFESRAELLSSLPNELPQYRDPNLSPYPDLAAVGNDERSDPYHFAPSLIREIRDCPGQEIGTHTFSHYLCGEPGQSASQFERDVGAAVAAAQRMQVELRSITFPRNQVNSAYLPICRKWGIEAFRGCSPVEEIHANGTITQSFNRARRVLDEYLVCGHCTAHDPFRSAAPLNVPSSGFLRSCSPVTSALDALRLRRIRTALTRAAERNMVYHLWLHPNDFGKDAVSSFAFLEGILSHFGELRDRTSMASCTMYEAVQRMQAMPCPA